MLEKIRSSTYSPILFLFLISIVLVAVWFRNGLIMGSGESGLPFYDINSAWERTSFAWKPHKLGVANGITAASLPTYWLLSSLNNLGFPSFAVQSFFLFVTVFISGISIFWLTKELFPKLKTQYLLIAVFFYWFNPFPLVNVWERFLYNFMVLYALLPFSLFIFIRAIKRKDLRLSIVFAISSVIFSFALASLVFNILLWLLLFFVAAYYFWLEKEKRGFIVKFFGLSSILYFLFNFWWIGQFISFIFSPNLNITVNKFFSVAGNVNTLKTLSERLGLLVYTSRFIHETSFNQGPFWIKFYVFPPLVFFQFILTGIIFWTIFKFRRTKEVLFLGFLFLITLFLMKGSNPPMGELFLTGFAKVPLLQVFRNPFEKFGFFLPLSAAPLFAFGLAKIGEQKMKGGFRKLFVAGVAIMVVFVWGFPFWTGLLFIHGDKSGSGNLKSFEVQVPDYYLQVNEWMKSRGSDFTFVSLPIGGEGMTYTWDKPYSGIELSSILFETPNVSFNTSIPFYQDLVNEISKYQLDKRVLDFLPFFSGKYIVWRGDIDFTRRRMADPSSVRRRLDQWANNGLLTQRYEAGELVVYEVNEDRFWPKIFIEPNVIYSNLSDLSVLVNFNTQFPKEKMVVLNDNHLEGGPPIDGSLAIEPEVVFTPLVSGLEPGITNDDILARLFYVKHLPAEKLYFLVRLKEKLLTPIRSDFSGWILYKTGILGKRAVEIHKLKAQGYEDKLIEKAERDYIVFLNELGSDLPNVLRGKSAVANVVRTSLLYQSALLKKSDSSISSSLIDKLIDWGIKAEYDLPETKNSYLVYRFEVRSSGTYSLKFDENIYETDFFLDGRPLYVSNDISNTDIKLDSGAHEIAMLANDNENRSLIIEKEEFNLNNERSENWEIDIADTPSTYKIILDYRFVKGEMFEIHFTHNIDEQESPSYSQWIRKDELYHGWSHWEGEFTSRVGAETGVLETLPAKKEVCTRAWWGGKPCTLVEDEFEVEIKDFQLSEVNYPSLLLFSGQGRLRSDTSTQWDRVSPVLYKVKINKKTSTPEILVFSEGFNSLWEAKYEDGVRIPDDKHFLVNLYANGWLIEKPGDYEIKLEFTPQVILERGKTVSKVSIFVGITLLGLVTWKRRKD